MITIYHNPRCSKSRNCLKLLQDQSVAINVIDYTKSPLSLATLKTLAEQLGLAAMVRTNESIYKSLNLNEADDETIFSTMLTHPQLLQRPIVVYGNQAIIARPPEKVLEFINE